MEETFEKIYNKVYDISNEKIKEAKNKKNKFLGLAILVLIAINVIIIVCFKATGLAFFSLWISFAIVIFLIFKGNKFYKDLYKKEVIETLVKEYNAKLSFDSKYGINKIDYRDSRFDKNFNEYKSEDRIYGKLNDGSNIQIAEVHAEEVHTYNDGNNVKTDTYTTFHGIFGIIRLNESTIIKLSVANDSHTRKFNKDRIEVDSAEFEEYYDLISKDKIEALKIFTPDLIEVFNEIRRAYPKKSFELKIEENIIYFRFNCGEIFEPPALKNGLDKKLLERYFKFIYYPIELSQKLVTKINDVIS